MSFGRKSEFFWKGIFSGIPKTFLSEEENVFFNGWLYIFFSQKFEIPLCLFADFFLRAEYFLHFDTTARRW